VSVIPLKRVAVIVAGQSPRSEDVSELGLGVPFLQGNAEFGSENPNPHFECNAASKHCEIGDILLSVRAPVGALNIADRRYAIGRGLCAIRASSEFIDQRYLWWWAKTQGDVLESVAAGSTYVAVTADQVGSLGVPLVGLDEQRRIADFLNAEVGRVGELIDARNRQIQLLEERFRFLAERKTGRITLKEDLSDSQNVVPLRRAVLGVQTGSTPPASGEAAWSLDGGEIAWYNPASVGEFMDISSPKGYVNFGLTPIFKVGSILFVGIGESIGKVAYLDHVASGNQQITALSPDVNVHGKFLSWQLWSAVDEFRESFPYTRVRIVNNDDLLSFPIYLPGLEEQRRVARELDCENRVLGQLRDSFSKSKNLMEERKRALITAAVTGQIDVTTARGADVS
jgi:type I restriction enzyme S subunit